MSDLRVEVGFCKEGTIIETLKDSLNATKYVESKPYKILIPGTFDTISKIPTGINHKGLMTSGAWMMGVSAGLTLIITIGLSLSADNEKHDAAKVLWVPLFGPIAANGDGHFFKNIYTVGYVNLAALETIGMGFLTTAFLERIHQKKLRKRNLKIYPTLSSIKTPGISMSGTF